MTDKKAATCTASGHSRKYCARCGKNVSKITYKKLGHDYRARKATAAEKKAYGWGTTLTCRRCGHKTGSYADYCLFPYRRIKIIRACRNPARRKGKYMIYIEEEKTGDRLQRFQAYARGLEEGTEDTEEEAEET